MCLMWVSASLSDLVEQKGSNKDPMRASEGLDTSVAGRQLVVLQESATTSQS